VNKATDSRSGSIPARTYRPIRITTGGAKWPELSRASEKRQTLQAVILPNTGKEYTELKVFLLPPPRGYVFAVVYVSLCKISQKVMNGF